MAAKKHENGLTHKQEAFCLAYTQLGEGHGNASIAYRMAYNVGDRTKPATIHRCAHELLQNPIVIARIKELQADAAKNVGLTVEKVLRNLVDAIDFDPRKLYHEDGRLKAVHELDADTASVLAGIEVVEMAGGAKIGGDAGIEHVPMYTKKLKWLDKNTARDQAMKHFGLYKRDNEQRKPDEKPFDQDEAARVIAFMLASAAKKHEKKQPV